MRDRFRAHLTDARLFPEPGLALVAVSGGPDSIALLRLLTQVAGDLGLTLEVAHVDHGIHPDSAAWAGAVTALSASLGVPVHVEQLHLGAGASETVARDARHAALERLRQARAARYIVTAHHADDQVETVLFRALRGSAPAGLAGIPAVQGALVRPLLPFRRDDLAPYAAGAVTDPANADPAHDRSWIRAVVLPLLRERFGGRVDTNLLDLARHAAEDRAAWDLATALVPGLRAEVEQGSVRVNREAVARLPAPLAAQILRTLARQAGLTLRPRHAARLVVFAGGVEGGRSLELGQGIAADRRNGILHLHAANA
ncbi:MAG: tRNA lysidine(34) synthetase TilS [Gemmatimonadales bacterium]